MLYQETISPAKWHAGLLDVNHPHFLLVRGPIGGYWADVLRLYFKHTCAATQTIGKVQRSRHAWKHLGWRGGSFT